MVPFPRKNNSRPLGDQIGEPPKPGEICHLPPPFPCGRGNGRTNTSMAPPSRDVYASQCPSGENRGAAVSPDSRRNGCGFPRRNPSWSSSTGAIQIPSSALPTSHLPLGEKEYGNAPGLPSVSLCGSLAPSARTQ